MSVARPARCLLTAPSKAAAIPCGARRAFTTSSSLYERRRPRFASIKAADLGLISTDPNQEPVMTTYTKEDKQALSKRYTPAQLRVIEAGEESINPEDLKTQGRFRIDQWKLPYLDDMSVVKPLIDKKPRGPREYSTNWRWMSEEERVDNMANWMFESKEKQPTTEAAEEFPSRLDWWKFNQENRQQVGYTAKPQDSLAPEIPYFEDDEYYYKPSTAAGDDEGAREHLRSQTGITDAEINELKIKNLISHFVTNQTRLGKINSIYCLSIAGDGNGKLGIGEGKAEEQDDAKRQSMMAAIRNMKPIPRYENRTIYGEVDGKVSASQVKLMSRPPGFGLRVQSCVFELAKCAGIHDLSARVTRSRNKMNTIKATYQALMSQRIPDEVARGLGRKLIDVRKVYYGGHN